MSNPALKGKSLSSKFVSYLNQGYPIDHHHLDGKRTSYLLLCAKNDLADLMRVLVFAGSDVNVRDKVGYTLMHHVCKTNNIKTLKYMLGCQAYNHLHEAQTNGGVTPLMYAV